MTEEQKNLLELLNVFSEICKDHRLQYYLAGGTLLGAVRHHGFIPWDDDIDVLMPFEDYQKFLQLKDIFPSHLIIDSENSNEKYPFIFSKLCNIRYCFRTKNKNGPKGIYIDIFPMLSSCTPNLLASACFNIIRLLNYVIQVKTEWTIYIPYKIWWKKLCFKLFSIFSKKFLQDIRKFLVFLLSKNESSYYFSPGGIHEDLKEFYPKSWFDKKIFLDFENKKFPVMSGWDLYLKQLYGEYMIMPDVPFRKTLHKE